MQALDWMMRVFVRSPCMYATHPNLNGGDQRMTFDHLKISNVIFLKNRIDSKTIIDDRHCFALSYTCSLLTDAYLLLFSFQNGKIFIHVLFIVMKMEKKTTKREASALVSFIFALPSIETTARMK